MRIEESGVTYLVDDDTGEIIGAEAPGFTVDDEKKAEWLLERLQDLDAQIAAVAAREKAVLDNLGTVKARLEAKRNGLNWKYASQLTDFAREHLPQGKKSWVCAYGSVQFRAVPARLKVADPEMALNWAKTECPHAIKISEEFQISKLTADDKAALMASPPSGFDVTQPTESVEIKTGV